MLRKAARVFHVLAVVSALGTAATPYAGAIARGVLIAFAGAGAWTVLARVNATIRPDLPWAAGVMALYLLALVLWLSGAGPPRASATTRRELLRMWPPQRDAARRADAH